jgi:serine/threonine protein kinase
MVIRNIPPHPNIVQVLGVSVDGPHPLIMLEYCAGGTSLFYSYMMCIFICESLQTIEADSCFFLLNEREP